MIKKYLTLNVNSVTFGKHWLRGKVMALNGIEEKKNDNYVGKVEDRLENRVDSQGR